MNYSSITFLYKRRVFGLRKLLSNFKTTPRQIQNSKNYVFSLRNTLRAVEIVMKPRKHGFCTFRWIYNAS